MSLLGNPWEKGVKRTLNEDTSKYLINNRERTSLNESRGNNDPLIDEDMGGGMSTADAESLGSKKQQLDETMGAGAMGMGGGQTPKPGAGQLNYRWHEPQRNLGNPLVLSSSDQLGSYMLQNQLWKEYLRRKWQDHYNQNVHPWQGQWPAP